MSIWFYIFLITILIIILLIIKIISIKKNLKDIGNKFESIINSDTNNLITVNTRNSDIIDLVSKINNNLKTLRKLRIEYENGWEDVKNSITNISHDLRTPLTAIKGYLDLMNIDKLDKKNLEYLNIIQKKTDELVNLVEDLFDYSNITDINKEKICINEFLEEILSEYYDLLNENKIIPDVYMSYKKIYIYADKEMLKRIFNNIISNVIKYSDSNLTIALKDNGNIEVTNKAINLDNVSMQKMFNRFYTVENGKNSSGIGLSIAKELTELNDGKIYASLNNNYLTITIKFNIIG